MTTAASESGVSVPPATFSYAAVASSNTSSTVSKKPARGSSSSPSPSSQANGTTATATAPAAPATSSSPAPQTTSTPSENVAKDTASASADMSAQSPSNVVVEDSAAARDDKNPAPESSVKSASAEQKKKSAETLVPAAPPAVNPWKKNASKTKPAGPAALPSPPPSETSKSPSTAPADVKPKANGEEKIKDDGESKDRKEGSRHGKKKGQAHESESAESVPPPSVNDISHWPTPDIAVEESKKDREETREKPTGTPGAGRGKWLPVQIDTPYGPPLPPKGGRGGRRGGREGGRVGSGARERGDAAERSGSGSGNAEGDRGRHNHGSNSRGGYHGPRGGKRSTSAGGFAQRRESKAGVNGLPERRREPREGGEQTSESAPLNGAQTDKPRRVSRDNKSGEETQGGLSTDARQLPEGQERQVNGQNAAPRDGQTRGEIPQAQQQPLRERNGERTRGGFRNRGGYHSQYSNGGHFNSGAYFQGHHASPPGSQYPLQTANYPQQQHGHPRGASFRARSQQAQFANSQFRYNGVQNQFFQQPYGYDYSMMPPNHSRQELDGLTSQINYYFSVDNLCKDIYLRKHMDDEGYVRVSFLLSFPRVASHAQDVNFVRDAILQSSELTLAQSHNEYFVRRRTGWERFVFPESERDPSAKGKFSANMTSPVITSSSWNVDPRQRNRFNNPTPPGEMSGTAEPFFPGPNGQPFYPQHLDQAYGAKYPVSQAGLSAAVPEFAPAPHHPMANGQSSAAVPVVAEDEISEEDVKSLVVVVKKPVGDSNPGSPVQPATVQTPGVAVVNGTSHAPLTNGSGPHEDAQTPQPLDATMCHIPYGEFYTQIMSTRQQEGPNRSKQAVVLYKFWSHALVKSFQKTMYDEFRRMAYEDAAYDIRTGVDELFKFYDRSLRERQTIGLNIIHDFVYAVKFEFERPNLSEETRQASVEKLKAVLRSQNLKEEFRRAIQGCVDPEFAVVLGDVMRPEQSQVQQ
ncbi:hypothetical protein EX30DRAFT_199168 [Ascodesmis nigricans]|uniref:HTH La-type RNA-binding domain-containing protein n=1 Tax=Ascodesmis nigricans TaxID=341454 RepID=A0A4S2MKV0_9PEZI|nr:hypothetical protein EX30DRAFT_199168 [Ascodesmis nigricans]